MVVVGRTVVVALLRVMFYRGTPAFVFDAPSWRPPLAHAFNGKKASASGTDSDGNRMTPRASAFRESTGPVLDAIGWLLACGIAQEHAPPVASRGARLATNWFLGAPEPDDRFSGHRWDSPRARFATNALAGVQPIG
jgi:hypothetical protein